MKNESIGASIVLYMGITIGIIFVAILAVMLLFAAINNISVIELITTELLHATIMLIPTFTLSILLYYRMTTAFRRLIVATIAFAILLPSAYLCLNELASQTIDILKWGSIATLTCIIGYTLFTQLTTNTAKSQNPTHSG